ncbi:MerR family transcriptional regulator [Oscillatoria laete-virens NRMC-F 0139]|nr:MerR family transcriptional regulator [Oscillatoria laete-virens NRMC-F 0139]
MKKKMEFNVDLVPASTFMISPGNRKEDEWTRTRFAKATGVNPETILYYEKLGLLMKPLRTRSGYRLYQRVHWVRINFIRNARELGFSLADISVLLRLQQHPRRGSSSVKKIAVQKLDALKSMIEQLREKFQTLSAINQLCDGRMTIKNCPILKSLDERTRLAGK